MGYAKTDLLAKLALFVVAITWGSSLSVIKAAQDTLSANLLLAMRFSIGALVLAIIFYKRVRKAFNRTNLIAGAIIGFCLYIAYYSQTLGVTLAMPGKSAFLSSAYCVIVPFLAWLFIRRKPDRYNLIAAFLCVIGLCIATFVSGFSVAPGDALALLAALLFAVHIVSIEKFSRDLDPIAITIFQFVAAAILSWVSAGIFERPISFVWDISVWVSLLYLALICTALALLLQNLGQQYTSSSSAALIMSLESIFGVIFGVLFSGEKLTVQLCIGFIFIFVAIVVSEAKPKFLAAKPKNNS